MSKVLITGELAPEGLRILRKHFDTELLINPERDELKEAVKNADALLCTSLDSIDEDILSEARKLRVISNLGVGYDNIDLEAASRRGIVVATTSETAADSRADHTMALLLASARNIVAADKHVREGKANQEDLMGMHVSGSTLGIIGLGEIGKEVAKRARGFGMNLIYNDEEREEGFEKRYQIEYKELDNLLQQSDFVSLHVPLNEETEHLIGVRELNLMKKSSHLVNTSRGEVVDEEALEHALRHRVIAGAGIDVFDKEPDFNTDLRELENIVLTPHIGGATEECYKQTSIVAAENVKNVLEGESPQNQVNEVETGPGFSDPFLINGTAVKNVRDLLRKLEETEEDLEEYLVENDFSVWAEETLGKKGLAYRLRDADGKEEAIKAVKNYLE